jgi:hypothetical protein
MSAGVASVHVDQDRGDMSLHVTSVSFAHTILSSPQRQDTLRGQLLVTSIYSMQLCQIEISPTLSRPFISGAALVPHSAYEDTRQRLLRAHKHVERLIVEIFTLT